MFDKIRNARAETAHVYSLIMLATLCAFALIGAGTVGYWLVLLLGWAVGRHI